jgi:ABC-type nitrate/sulfonate/bicarbonate transport system permease component
MTNTVPEEAQVDLRQAAPRRPAGVLYRLANGTPLPGIALAAVILLVWQFVTPVFNFTGVPVKYLGSPSGVWRAFLDVFQNGYDGTSFTQDILASLERVVVGFCIGATAALVLGTLMGYYQFIGRLLSPVLNFIRPIPALAFIPVVIIWFGIGETPKILVISFAAFIYAVLGVSSGIRSIPMQYMRIADNYGLNRRDRFFHVILPAALPHIVPGMRTAMALSWAVVVTAELIASQDGLGHIVIDASNFFNIDVVYVGIVFIGLIGFVMDLIFRLVIGRFLHWSGK